MDLICGNHSILEAIRTGSVLSEYIMENMVFPDVLYVQCPMYHDCNIIDYFHVLVQKRTY